MKSLSSPDSSRFIVHKELIVALLSVTLLVGARSAASQPRCEIPPDVTGLQLIDEVATCPALPHIGSSVTGTDEEIQFGRRVTDAIAASGELLREKDSDSRWEVIHDLYAIAHKPVDNYGYGNGILDIAACTAFSGLLAEQFIAQPTVPSNELTLPSERCLAWDKLRTVLLQEVDELNSVQSCVNGTAAECYRDMQIELKDSGRVIPLAFTMVMVSTGPALTEAFQSEPDLYLLVLWTKAADLYDLARALADMRASADVPLAQIPSPDRGPLTPTWFLQKVGPWFASHTWSDPSDSPPATYSTTEISYAIKSVVQEDRAWSAWGLLGEVSLRVSRRRDEAIVHPATINRASEGNWITAYIEVGGADPLELIDLSKPILLDVIPAVSDPQYGWVSDPEHHDKDGDGQPELMVKFSREDVIDTYGEHDSVQLPVLGHYQDGLRLVAYTTLEFVGDDD